MQKKRKTEKRALIALEEVIDKYETLDAKFNDNDKEMSWDGSIDVYRKSNKDFSKETFRFRVPVQIKGKSVSEKKISEKTYTFPIELENLRIYFDDGGVLYFVILLNKGEKEIFYNILFPTKIKSILENAKAKGNKHSINVGMQCLKTENFENIIEQCKIEFDLQAGQMKKVVFDIENFSGDFSLSACVAGANNPEQIINAINSGDGNFYISKKGEEIKYPLPFNTKIYIENYYKVDKVLNIGGKNYFENRIEIKKSGNLLTVNLGNVLTLDFDNYNKTQAIHFNRNNPCMDFLEACEFLIECSEAETININEKEMFRGLKELQGTELYEHSTIIFKILKMLQNLHFDMSINFSSLSGKDLNCVYSLCIKNEKMGPYILEVVSRKMFIFVNEIEGQYQVYNICHSGANIKLAMKGTDEEMYPIPILFLYDSKALSMIDFYDIDYLKREMSKIHVTEAIKNEINMMALKYISVYDESGNFDLLDLSSILLEKLLVFDNDYIYINFCQLKKRHTDFTEEMKTTICNIRNNSNDELVQFACEIILDNNYNARCIFNKLSKDKINYIKDFPIYNLYKKKNQ